MEKQLDITIAGDTTEPPSDAPITDPLTRYPIQIWEQKTLVAHRRIFILRYYRDGKWRKGSAQMLDRNLRRFGLPGLTDVPWGAGEELGYAADDWIETLTLQEHVLLSKPIAEEVGD
jgi:hypothetical protein